MCTSFDVRQHARAVVGFIVGILKLPDALALLLIFVDWSCARYWTRGVME